jgi:hypothetical protein
VQRFFHGWPLQIVVLGVESADELIELEGGFPDITQKTAAQAAPNDASASVDSGAVAFVPGAAAIELAGANFQGSVVNRSDFLDFVLYVLYFLYLAFKRRLEIANTFSEAFRQFRYFLGAEQEHKD